MLAAGELPGSRRNSSNESQPLLENGVLQIQKNRTSTKKMLKLFGAAICITVFVTSWVIVAEKLQDLGSSYQKPFFQAYWIHSMFSIVYIFWKLWLVFPGHCSCNNVGEGTLTNFKKLAIVSGLLNIISFASTILWYISLSRTSVSANTAIYQSASAVIFIISVPVLGERVTLVKIASVACTVIGVCVVSLLGNKHSRCSGGPHNGTLSHNDTNEFTAQEEGNTPLGYVYVVLSMVLYAVQETFYKRFATREDDTAPVFNGARVLGYFGVHTLFCYWPLLIIVHFTGIERFELPTLQSLYMLLVMAVLEGTLNTALLICIALSSPLFASVGSMLTIPMSIMLDWILKDYVLSWQSFIGVGVIIIGFFGIIASEYWKIRNKEAETAKEHGDRTFRPPNSIQTNVSSTSRHTKISFRSRLLHFII